MRIFYICRLTRKNILTNELLNDFPIETLFPRLSNAFYIEFYHEFVVNSLSYGENWIQAMFVVFISDNILVFGRTFREVA